MKPRLRIPVIESVFLLLLLMGLVVIAKAQSDVAPQRKVKIEVEVTENGKTSRSVQELSLDRESIGNQLDEMVEEIEMILEEAVRDAEETDLEISIRRNTDGALQESDPYYHHHISVIPPVPPVHPVPPPGMPGTHSWQEGEIPPKAFLGVYASGLDGEELKALSLEKAVRLDGVVDGSAAADAGLMEGDIVLSIGGEKVGTFAEVAGAVRKNKPGTEVEITFKRNGELQKTTARLGSQHTYGQGYRWKEVSRAYLGVKGRNADASDAPGPVRGAYLNEIVENTPAARGGLRKGDIIVSMDGEDIGSFEKLGEVIRSRHAGEEVEVEIIRDGKRETLDVTLGEQHVKTGYGNSWPDFPRFDSWASPNMENRAFLGIMGHTDEERKGVVVQQVFEGSAAEDMGLEEEDVIHKINGTEVGSIEALVEKIGTLEPGEEVEVEFDRNGDKMLKTGKLKSRKDHQGAFTPLPCDMGTHSLRRMVIYADGEEARKEEIRELNKASGLQLDEDNLLEMSEFRLTPNPGNGLFTLYIDLPGRGDTQIRIFNQGGQLVYERSLKDFSGIYSSEIDITGHAAGMYFVSVTQNGHGKMSRIIKN